MLYRDKIILLPPNRVWRTYPGGKILDQLAQVPAPADTHLAEDWIASATRASNPPDAARAAPDPARTAPTLAPPGISCVRVGSDPTLHDFAELLARDPDYFLGPVHAQKHGAQPQLLVKFLDSGTRLHFQVHPTREFAQRVLGAPSGKTEAYYVLGVRGAAGELSPAATQSGAHRGALTAGPDQPVSTGGAGSSGLPSSGPGARAAGSRGAESIRAASSGTERRGAAPAEATGYIYVGFQRPPTPAQLRAYILTQDIAAIAACFDPIPVRPGDTFIIPGGTPHALGAGVFMVEIQEPSDLVVRFEFERAGYVLPESARFMNRDLDFALTVFNLAPLTPAELDARVRCRPRRIRELGAGSWQDELIGAEQTDCFRVRRTHLAGPVVKDENSGVIAIVTSGAVLAEVSGESHRLGTYDKFFLPFGLGPVTLTPLAGPAEILECYPPA